MLASKRSSEDSGGGVRWRGRTNRPRLPRSWWYNPRSLEAWGSLILGKKHKCSTECRFCIPLPRGKSPGNPGSSRGYAWPRRWPGVPKCWSGPCLTVRIGKASDHLPSFGRVPGRAGAVLGQKLRSSPWQTGRKFFRCQSAEWLVCGTKKQVNSSEKAAR